MLSSLKAKAGIALTRYCLGEAPFGVISNNCWGSHIYQKSGLAYTTPFIGLFISPTSYLRLLSKWPESIYQQLTFKEKSEEPWIEALRNELNHFWPIGFIKLSDLNVEIQFMHYTDAEDAALKWNRRVQRLPENIDRHFFKFDDRDGCTREQMKAFDSLPFPNKVLFLKNQLSEVKCGIQVSCAEDCVPDGRMLSMISPKVFDAAAWISGRRPRAGSFLSRV